MCLCPASPEPCLVCLKFLGQAPVVVGPAFWTALLLPKDVGTLTQTLVISAMPMFLRTPLGAAVALPQEVGEFANSLLEALLRLGQRRGIIPVWSQSSTPTDMHSGGQA